MTNRASQELTPKEVKTLKRRIDAARIDKILEQKEVRDAVLWLAYLSEDADPTPGRPADRRPRSAERPPMHEPTANARRAWERAVDDLRYMTARVQKALGVPVEQRTMVVETRRPHVEVTRQAPVKASEQQRNTIGDLAAQVYGSVGEMERQRHMDPGAALSLDRLSAQRLIRSLKG